MRNTMPVQPALLLKNVTLELGDGDEKVRPLNGVNLEVFPGELVAIIGPSGSGKSSLLAVAGALGMPDEGTVQVLGKDVQSLGKSQGKLAKFRLRNIGFVFQSGNLIPSLTAADQLRLVHKIAGGGTGFDPTQLLEAVGLAHRANHRPGRLSGGERQRVGIARALVTKPGVLLVDEPTAALDRSRSRQIVELLAQQAHEKGVATVMVTHDYDVLGYCDRVLEMEDGVLKEYHSAVS